MKAEALFCIYLGIVNAAAVFLTVADKHQAKKGKWRISENTLLCTAALGGAVFMLFTMKWIHHKTKHKKFMLGLPVIIAVQIIIAGIVYFV